MARSPILAWPRVAIATLWDYAERYECALPLWCDSGRTLVRIIPNSELVLLVPAGRNSSISISMSISSSCPGATRFWHEPSSEMVEQYLQRQRPRRGEEYVAGALHKVALLALPHPLVLYADLDFDLTPSPFLTPSRDELALSIHAFWSSGALLAGSPDHSAPLNTGLLLLRPTQQALNEALQTLADASWSEARGFANVGRPRELHYDLQRIAAGGDGDARAALSRLNATAMMREDAWSFVNAGGDQGLFWYLYYVKHPEWGTWAGARGCGFSRWRALHYWGGALAAPRCALTRSRPLNSPLSSPLELVRLGWKPWRPFLDVGGREPRKLAINLHYLTRVRQAQSRAGWRAYPYCAAELSARLAEGDQHRAWLEANHSARLVAVLPAWAGGSGPKPRQVSVLPCFCQCVEPEHGALEEAEEMRGEGTTGHAAAVEQDRRVGSRTLPPPPGRHNRGRRRRRRHQEL